ncbi:MAG: iron ABC transporter permease [Alphaproteobacteria bacterium]|nr:iron ABC transporter permease [Alphaproteobacteria bacterium]
MRAWLGMLLVLLVAIMIGISAGHGWASPADVLRAVAGDPSLGSRLLVEWRIPRVLAAALVGALLGLGGTVFQGVFRNPLADPGVLGITGGATLGAVTAIFFGASAMGGAVLPLAGFAGALVAAVAVDRLARVDGRIPVASLLLSGIALEALSRALTGVLIYASDDRQLRDITLWLLGSYAGASWDRLMLIAPFALLAAGTLPFFARGLDALMLGEREAGHLGIPVETLKRLAVGVAALGVGAVVSVAGPVGFVGLVVPHLVRLTHGPGHRRLIPLAAAYGAALSVAADTLARILVAPAELPVGLVTAAIGAPFFAFLIRREKRRLAA